MNSDRVRETAMPNRAPAKARRLRSFLKAEGGNAAMVVALALAPISLAALGAVDLSRATSAKVQLQDALDAAALAAGRSNTNDPDVLQATGQRVLEQNLALDSDFHLAGSAFTFGENGKVMASANATVRPFIAGLVTGGDLAIGASTEVVRANTKLEIALVLDNTGSMAGSKLSNLKTAASNFVDYLQQAASHNTDPYAVKISLVPFSQTVRVGSEYASAPWIDQNGSSPINNEIFTTSSGVQWANRFTLLSSLGTSWGGCVESRQAPYDIQDTAPAAGAATVFTPYFAPDEPDWNGYDNNYVSDNSNSSSWKVRQGKVDKYVHRNGLSTNWGPNRGCGLQTLRRLTNDFAALKTDIGNMTATGDTNIPIGLVWGWHTLSPKAPFADGVAYGTAKHKKIVVLMTDGQNTITDSGNSDDSYYSGSGYIWQGRVIKANGSPLTSGTGSTRTAALDDRLSKLCANMKAAGVGIEIYTVRVEVNSGSSAVLQNCASGADHFFDVQSASELNSVFQSIANQIANLHLAK
jgi:Flp pilus assembly protein TadG